MKLDWLNLYWYIGGFVTGYAACYFDEWQWWKARPDAEEEQ